MAFLKPEMLLGFLPTACPRPLEPPYANRNRIACDPADRMYPIGIPAEPCVLAGRLTIVRGGSNAR